MTKAEAQRKFRHRQRRMGLCRTCAKVATHGQYCKRHHSAALRHRLKHRGANVEDLGVFLSNQDGVCAICFQSDSLVVDHDHETGKVRGLLCRKCNNILGQAEDSIPRLKSAIVYLKRAKL